MGNFIIHHNYVTYIYTHTFCFFLQKPFLNALHVEDTPCEGGYREQKAITATSGAKLSKSLLSFSFSLLINYLLFKPKTSLFYIYIYTQLKQTLSDLLSNLNYLKNIKDRDSILIISNGKNYLEQNKILL